MRFSRFEKYLAIIKVLDNGDALAEKQIVLKANLNLVSPKEDLAFLVNLDIISEENLGNRTTYSITQKGQKVSVFFRLKDDRRYLRALE